MLIGAKVRVVDPTGGVRKDDVFVVVEKPADRNDYDGFVWVEFDGPIDAMRPFTKYGRVMGFHHASLEQTK